MRATARQKKSTTAYTYVRGMLDTRGYLFIHVDRRPHKQASVRWSLTPLSPQCPHSVHRGLLLVMCYTPNAKRRRFPTDRAAEYGHQVYLTTCTASKTHISHVGGCRAPKALRYELQMASMLEWVPYASNPKPCSYISPSTRYIGCCHLQFDQTLAGATERACRKSTQKVLGQRPERIIAGEQLRTT